MKGIQLQLQIATEHGIFNHERLRHVNKLKGEYSVLFRELRKRKHVNKGKRILQRFNVFEVSNSLKSKVSVYAMINVYIRVFLWVYSYDYQLQCIGKSLSHALIFFMYTIREIY